MEDNTSGKLQKGKVSVFGSRAGLHVLLMAVAAGNPWGAKDNTKWPLVPVPYPW